MFPGLPDLDLAPQREVVVGRCTTVPGACLKALASPFPRFLSFIFFIETEACRRVMRPRRCCYGGGSCDVALDISRKDD